MAAMEEGKIDVVVRIKREQVKKLKTVKQNITYVSD